MTSQDSPALKHRSPHWPWPVALGVPRLVRALRDVRSELPFPPFLVVKTGRTYEVWVNSHGALSALLPDGELGLKPGEFQVVEWHHLDGAPTFLEDSSLG